MTSDAPTDAARIEALFDEVVDLDPEAASKILASAPERVREAVERLVAHDRAAGPGFLEPSTLRARETARALEDPSRVGRYVVLRKLGGGGMGDVYAAYDESLDRKIALKILRARVPDAWLRREAHALARLAHPNVVSVHEIGEGDGRPFVAMELVDGVTLRDWLADKRTPEEIVRMFVQCGRGLVAAHDAGIVHRDFKPLNVIVGHDGRARVLDFGIAALDDATSDEDAHLGTPHFMSPEQHAGEHVTAASDQWSLAAALYRALYDKAPFAGDDLGAIRKNVLAGALRAVPKSDAPSWIGPIVLRGLARHPAARFESMAEMLAAIEARLPRDPDSDPSVSARGRRTLAVGMLGCAAAVLAALAWQGGPRTITTVSQLLAISTFLFGASAVGAIAVRRLLANRFGARFASVIVIGNGTLLVHRLFAWRFDQPFAQVIAIDMVILAFELLLAGILLQRWFAWGAGVMFGGALVATFVPGLALVAMAGCAVTTLALGAALWRD